MQFAVVSLFSNLLPVVAGIIKYRQLSLKLKLLFAFYLFSALLDFYSFYLGIETGNNMILFNLYGLIEVVVYILIFIPLILRKKRIAASILLSIIWILIFLATTYYTGDIKDYNPFFNIFENSFLLILFGRLIFKSIDQTDIPLYKNSFFWIGSGIIIYSTISFS